VLRGLKRLLPLPWANSTTPVADGGRISSPASSTAPAGMVTWLMLLLSSSPIHYYGDAMCSECLAEFFETSGDLGMAIRTMSVGGKAVLFDLIPIAHDQGTVA